MVIKTAQPLDNAFIVKAIRDKLDFNHRLQRLHDYYVGKHDILLRVQGDPAKPNNRVVVNQCKKIADFITSYLVGVPVRYEAPQVILDNLNYNDTAANTHNVVLNMNIYGLGCELFYTDTDGIPRFASIDPREAIFVYDDSIEDILTAFIRVYPKEVETEGYNVTVYTATDSIQYDLSLSIGQLMPIGQAQPHYFQDVPAIIYPNNNELIGTFEGIMSLQDALNKILSDEMNDFESAVDAFLVLTGMQATQPEDIAKMRQDRVLLMEPDSSAQWLIKQVNNDHIRELKQDITRKIYDLGNIPDVENLGSFGASGVALKFKLINTEIQASEQERTVTKGIQRKMELLYNIFRITDPGIGEYTDVSVEFERNFIMLTDDKQQKLLFGLQLVAAGLLKGDMFYVKYMGMTPEEAAAMLPETVELLGRD